MHQEIIWRTQRLRICVFFCTERLKIRWLTSAISVLSFYHHLQMNQGAAHSVSWGQGFPRRIWGCLQAFQERWKTLPKEKQPEVVVIFVISIPALFQELPEMRQPMALSFVPICNKKHELHLYYLEMEKRWNQISRLDRRIEEYLPPWRVCKVSQRWVTTRAHTASHLCPHSGSH